MKIRQPRNNTELIVNLITIIVATLFCIGITLYMKINFSDEYINNFTEESSVEQKEVTCSVGPNYMKPMEVPTIPELPPEPEYRELEVTITYYCSCPKCCGVWSKQHPKRINDPNYIQRTAGGMVPRNDIDHITIAVDTKQFRPDLKRSEFFKLPEELREVKLVDSNTQETKLNYYMEDVGGAIKGNHIDIYMNSHEEALSQTMRTAKMLVREDLYLGGLVTDEGV